MNYLLSLFVLLATIASAVTIELPMASLIISVRRDGTPCAGQPEDSTTTQPPPQNSSEPAQPLYCDSSQLITDDCS